MIGTRITALTDSLLEKTVLDLLSYFQCLELSVNITLRSIVIVDEVDKFSFFGSDARSETSTIVQIVSVTLREDQLATLPNNLSLCTRKESVGRIDPRTRGVVVEVKALAENTDRLGTQMWPCGLVIRCNRFASPKRASARYV